MRFYAQRAKHLFMGLLNINILAATFTWYMVHYCADVTCVQLCSSDCVSVLCFYASARVKENYS